MRTGRDQKMKNEIRSPAGFELVPALMKNYLVYRKWYTIVNYFRKLYMKIIFLQNSLNIKSLLLRCLLIDDLFYFDINLCSRV